MKLVKINQSDIPNLFNIGLENLPCVMYVIYDKPFVWIMRDRYCNLEKIKELGIDYIELPNNSGSTIVASAKDLDFGLFGDREYCEEMLGRIVGYISKVLTDGRLVNNDMMYGGCKYGAISKSNIGNGNYFYAVHLSNYIDKELINEICTKTMFKIPNSLPIKITEENIPNIFNEVIENGTN